MVYPLAHSMGIIWYNHGTMGDMGILQLIGYFMGLAVPKRPPILLWNSLVSESTIATHDLAGIHVL